MSNKALVKKQVLKAFERMGDLKVAVVFTKLQPSGFDFGTGLPIAVPAPSTVTTGIILEKKSPPVDGIVKVKQTLIVVAEGLEDLSQYDEVLIDGVVWSIKPPIVNNGYTIELIVSRKT